MPTKLKENLGRIDEFYALPKDRKRLRFDDLPYGFTTYLDKNEQYIKLYTVHKQVKYFRGRFYLFKSIENIFKIGLVKGERSIINNRSQTANYINSIIGGEYNIAMFVTIPGLKKAMTDKSCTFEDIVFEWMKSNGLHKDLTIQNVLDLCSMSINVNLFHDAFKDFDAFDTFKNNNHDIMTIRDMITQAIKLNVKLSCKWSVRRFLDEHTRMTRELTKLLRGPVSKDILYNVTFKKDNAKSINSESEIADEADDMHHCLFVNYRYNILNKSYCAMHYTLNNGEGVTVGIRYNNDEKRWMFDQKYKKYDNRLSDEESQEIEPTVNEFISWAENNVTPRY